MSLSMTLAFVLSLTQAQDPKPQPKPEPKVEAPKADAPKVEMPKERSPIDVWFEDGLRFKSKDGNFEAKIGGRYLAHYRTIFDRPQDTVAPVRSVPNTFFTRQARLETEGTLLKEWGYKVQVDFASGAISQPAGTAGSNVSGTLRDGFVEWKKYKEFQVRMGQFFEPISQEDISSTRFIDFAERSIMNRLLPGREIGVQVAGNLGAVSYAVMLCNGNALLNDQGRAVTDSNDQKEVAALLRYSPFLGSEDDALKGLRFGLAGSYGVVDRVAAGGFDLTSTELSITYAEATGTTLFDTFRVRVNPQISYSCGPFAFRGEYLYRVDGIQAGPAPDGLRTKGWYGYATYILTGENKKVEDRIVPLDDWGAVELGFRVAQVHIDDAFTSTIFSAASNANTATSYTFGVNWWVARNVRITLNVIREKYNNPLVFDREDRSMFMGAILRAQVDF